jgi:hypothetical protein
MFHPISHFALLAQLAVTPAVPEPSVVPFDTTISVARLAGVALSLEAGGRVHIVGGDTKAVRVQVTDHGKRCADCIVAVSQMGNAISVRTGRARTPNELADLQVQVDVPTHTNILLTSAGGQVAIEGIDGYVSGTTESGALQLLRLSGAVKLETKRGDVTLRQSYVRGTVHTNDGRVLMEDVAGDVQGTTSKGRVTERRVEKAGGWGNEGLRE